MPREKQDGFMLRFPPGFRDEVKNKARENGRSMTMEILHRLQQAYKYEDEKKKAAQILGGTSGLL